MSWYTVALFAHIVGVLTLFITMAVQWLVTLRLRRAESITQAREWAGLVKSIGRMGPVTGILILGAGLSMTATDWGMLTTWIDVSIAAMVIMMVFSMGMVGRRLRAIQRAAGEAPTGAIPAALQVRIDDPTLWVSMQMAVTVALSIVFMTTNKPNLVVSIVSVIVSLGLGALLGAMTLRPRRMSQPVGLGMNEGEVR